MRTEGTTNAGQGDVKTAALPNLASLVREPTATSPDALPRREPQPSWMTVVEGAAAARYGALPLCRGMELSAVRFQ
jgi:hypothetical protein